MEHHPIKRPNDCAILIVDDEEVICRMLADALTDHYVVTTCLNGTAACALIDRTDFDVVVTDLKLPDISGLEVLSYAKHKDEFTEVIVITGYASLDSVTLAINQGVYSYLLKPLMVTDFVVQVEKAVASRLFHLRSLELMRQADELAPDVKLHVHEITSLYYFLRKLMLSLEIAEIMRITLDEVNRKMGSVLSVISVAVLGYQEHFAMPSFGEVGVDAVVELLQLHRDVVPHIEDAVLFNGGVTPVIYKGCLGTLPSLTGVKPLSVPMMVTDQTMGTLTVFFSAGYEPKMEQNQFLYVFSSIVSSVVNHGYVALQARQQAKTDSLTGIANHRHFHETLDREIARANRRRISFGLILLDIDYFKRVNDTYGHQVGDAVLVDMTRRINEMIRAGDVLARYGGEEFGLILPETSLGGAEILADRILHAISSRPFEFAGREIAYTASIGLAVYQGGVPVEKDRLIAAADKALYASKEAGRNRLSIGTVTV